MSSNLHVYMNAVEAVPGAFALKQETPAWWFSGIYDCQRHAGYGFSQDAEAYLTFGWLGPPLWFPVWGYLLAQACRRIIVNPKIPDLFIWQHLAATSAFAIRSGTRGLFKMVVLGIAAAVVIRKVAEVIGYLEARKLSNPRRSLPHFRRANEGPK